MALVAILILSISVIVWICIAVALGDSLDKTVKLHVAREREFNQILLKQNRDLMELFKDRVKDGDDLTE